MRRIIIRLSWAIALLTLCGGSYLAGSSHLLAPQRSAAADDCQTFAETGKMVCGTFLAYWKDHGGLAQQGFPISGPFEEKSETDGKTYTVQYFERAVFEAHPEFSPPNNVLLSLVGSQKFKSKYPSGAPTGAVSPTVAPPSSGDAVGQTLTCKCNFDKVASFSIAVTDIKRANMIGAAAPNGVFALFFAHVTNTSTVSSTVQDAGLIVLDAQGRTFTVGDRPISVQLAAQNQYNVKGFFTTVQPSLTVDMVFVFDIAPNATGLKLAVGKQTG